MTLIYSAPWEHSNPSVFVPWLWWKDWNQTSVHIALAFLPASASVSLMTSPHILLSAPLSICMDAGYASCFQGTFLLNDGRSGDKLSHLSLGHRWPQHPLCLSGMLHCFISKTAKCIKTQQLLSWVLIWSAAASNGSPDKNTKTWHLKFKWLVRIIPDNSSNLRQKETLRIQLSTLQHLLEAQQVVPNIEWISTTNCNSFSQLPWYGGNASAGFSAASHCQPNTCCWH